MKLLARNILTPKRGLRNRHVRTLALAMLVVAVWPASALAAPANDDFADAQLITGTEGTVTGSNLGATKEAGEPDHAGNLGGRSVWYSWTAPADGNVAFTTAGSLFDTLLAVYTGGAVGSLTAVAANDDDPSRFTNESTVSFAVSSGVTYMVAVDGFSGKVGFINLTWRPAPANDNFADAQVLASTSSGTATGNARGATVEPGEPPFFGEWFPTIWYSWTAPADGTYKFDTLGSNFDTVLHVYEGSSLDALVLVGANDDDPDRGCCSSWVPIANATAGTIYSIAVSPLGGSGLDVVLNWSPLILGTPGGDSLIGTTGADEIRGQGGADVLRGRGGNDTLFGGRGSDEEYGGAGDDLVLDRRGADRLSGGTGDDRLNARDFRSNDRLFGGLGVDRCRGDVGDIRRGCP
jgi:Ca2+-binding RTX toxin-like protein